MRWDRSDGWALMAVLWGAVILVGGLMVAVPAVRMAGLGVSEARVPVELDRPVSAPAGLSGDGLAVEGVRDAVLVVSDPAPLQRVLAEGPTLLAGVLWLAGLVLVVRIAATLRDGDAFAPANPRRLLAVAGLVLAGAVLVPLVRALAADRLAAQVPAVDEAVVFGFGVSLMPMVAAVMVAALAEAFRRGTELREDTEGLI
ncbi:DUF2975 domain-containing protein [Nocardiopsis chromatogenes]|uniref:DUF2975 domain-containing protein n=1 Tax=Nocardiopsis chromatogenes TaxID=280239 RepID=UPI00037059A1|nr:DUF2975 domain-containing protein [Nocardiopsis chromatogenes]